MDLRTWTDDVTEAPQGHRAPAVVPARLRDRELEVAREIADSFLTASSAVEVYRVALARITPLVGASFASVFLRDGEDPDLLRLACAQNWPQSTARFLGDLRIREGRGPTGRAVSTGRPVEVTDVFQDPALEEWWTPARELGFVSMKSLPLTVEERVLGALSFYFRDRQEFGDDARSLMMVVAHQLAATAERAQLVTGLRSSNLRLERDNEALRRSLEQVEVTLDRLRADRDEEVRSPRSSRSGPDPESR
jgi:GAF domain-containing protein